MNICRRRWAFWTAVNKHNTRKHSKSSWGYPCRSEANYPRCLWDSRTVIWDRSTHLHFTSSHLNFTQVHFTTLSFGLTPFKFPTAPFHLTSLHFTSLHCAFRWFSPHFCCFHFTPFTIAFLTLCLKILGLQGKVPNVSAGSWFQFLMVLFTKEYFSISVLCFLSLIFWTWSPLLK